jgi:hypothetical protein
MVLPIKESTIAILAVCEFPSNPRNATLSQITLLLIEVTKANGSPVS